jgi:hypothetical protein
MTALTHVHRQGEFTMKALSLTTMSLAVIGLSLVAGANVATAKSKQTGASAYECFTDDGYGRKRPCSAGYMQKRADSNAYECFTDDGYGRKLPCSFRIKR